ncbi:MAG: hypothetical protein HOV81_26320 [Kofleriaceae bacterium]|nr:hypothetical protein [Kofleriaceae bacterium]
MDIQIPEVELQHELQRFATRFIERVTQCADALQQSPRSAIREEALRKNLLYASAAMEIVTGPSSAVNLLDMFVFLHLSRHVLEQHWIPSLYGAAGNELDSAFEISEEELKQITIRAIGDDGFAKLTGIVDTWLADNPGAIRVENMRLSDFAAAAGAASSARALEAKGLLSGMKVATAAANQAMVIAERGMFLLHRMPYVLRLHARLAVRDSVDDVLLRIKTGDEVPALTRFAKQGAVLGLLGIATTGFFLMRLRRKHG